MIKYFLIILISLLLGFNAIGQIKVDINAPWIDVVPADASAGITDASYLFDMAPDGYFEIYETSSFENIIMEGAFMNEEMQGVWTFYNGGNISEIVNYHNGYRQGEYKAFYPSGSIKASASYNKGLLDGKYIIFNEDGSVRNMYEMNNGEIN